MEDLSRLNGLAERIYQKLFDYLVEEKGIHIYKSNLSQIEEIYSHNGKRPGKGNVLAGLTTYEGAKPSIYINAEDTGLGKLRTLMHEYGVHVLNRVFDTDRKNHAYYHRKSLGMAGRILGRTAENLLKAYEKYLADNGDAFARDVVYGTA